MPDDSETDNTPASEQPQGAANWTSDGDHTRPEWMTSERGAMTVMEIRLTSGEPVDISEVDAEREIAARVGTANLRRLVVLEHVQVWLGVDAAATEPVNLGATRFVHQLIESVSTGDYAAGDAERDSARRLLAHPENLPVIHGTCVVTGVGVEGEAASFDTSFQDWFTRLIDLIQENRAAETVARLREAGLPVEWAGGKVYTFDY
ncbi:hypothetical protein [Actinokineospora iranica]|uniref:Uncharacterized protein n=1 Tax=Actinokineospora iranica TaxID=1271860 RepID=A0A1G6VQ74_9PSEU|nr:hypothetical protein [Actinokineospora iranica]SDD55691.1 hypothetical protein SAMN05216174_11335 [Actinokineospora iranica]